MTAEPMVRHDPIDDIADRLNDPAIASAIVLMLDHVEALTFLAMGADGLLRRGQTIADTLAEGLADLRTGAGTMDLDGAREQVQELVGLANLLVDSSDQLTGILQSGLLNPEVIGILSETAAALVTARRQAATTAPEITGALSLYKVTKDPDVQRGLSFLVGIARALGQGMQR